MFRKGQEQEKNKMKDKRNFFKKREKNAVIFYTIARNRDKIQKKSSFFYLSLLIKVALKEKYYIYFSDSM